tara:strand:+ start:2003 stop:2416 length:414 start_codon:yes stop_codon:yes gene_type:complete
MTDEVRVSDSTAISMPMRNLLSIVGACLVGAWFGFGVIERLNIIETEIQLMQADLEKNTEFRIKWPRGELGSLPADSEQFMLIEYIGTQIEAIEEDLKDLPKDRSQDLTINFFEDRILKLEDAVEDLKDKVRQNGND